MDDMHEPGKWAKQHCKVIVFAEGIGNGARMIFDFRNPLDPMSQLQLTMLAFAAEVESTSIKERVIGAQSAMHRMPLRWRGGGRPGPVGGTPARCSCGGRVVTRPHRKFRKDPPPWYEEMHAREKHAHSSRRIRVEHGIAHLKDWRTLARHHGHRETLPETMQAVAAVVSHRQSATRPLARTV
ncbi:hypothetical protein [Streptomyces caatingaensis]|uniref:hypothetical protein n=1 Tax=Streptomyces caatingaensis TaxID=1678637 RepID=UPI000AFF7F84|nr:hypothetical protein [Streptomyces caatingaensis]